MKISKLTILVGLFIILSAFFMQQVMEFFKVYIGERGVVIFVGLILLSTASFFLIFILLRNTPGIKKTLAIIALLLFGLLLTWLIKIPQERIHILEYAILGWLASQDLILNNQRRIKGTISAWALTIWVGVTDEILQKILPYRVGDFRDIIFNSLGGLWGVALFWLSLLELKVKP